MEKEVEIKGNKYYVLQSDVSATSPNYSKVVSYVSAKEFLPIKAECYDKESKLLKTIDFSDYKKLPGNKFRAGTIKIRNGTKQAWNGYYFKRVQIKPRS